MSDRLSDITFRSAYDSQIDSPVKEFLIPALNASSHYDRAVGFFSGAILTVLAEAFTDFAERGGTIRLVCSPILSSSDATILESTASFKILNQAIDRLDEDGIAQAPLDLLAALILRRSLKLKFAIPYAASADLFHLKMGIFRDLDGSRVAFNGSNNESVSGWFELRNAEDFWVAASWRGEGDLDKIEHTERNFRRIWEDQYPNFDVISYDDGLGFIQRRQHDTNDLAEIKSRVKSWYSDRTKESSTESDSLYPYQRDVLDDWNKSDRKGIVCFATGAGKTRTAISAMQEWRTEINKRVVIILVPSERLQSQWLKEIRKQLGPGTTVLLVGGEGRRRDWEQALVDATSYKRHPNDGIIVAVSDTSSTESFISRVQWGRHVLLVADEVHNLGAPSYINLLGTISVGAILGLSATPERYNDDETKAVRDIFGNDLKPVVDIPMAQDLGVLVPYRYRYETVQLSEHEEERYASLSRSIAQASARLKSSPESGEDNLTKLRSARANIVKSAEQKPRVAANIILREYKQGQWWVVFCNDRDQLSKIEAEIADLRPIPVYSGMSGDIEATLRHFEQRGGILLSIHQLDEGIDIPAIDHCVIVASSQSKREFIQRRGRVLRVDRSRPKGVAEIWDIVVVDEFGFAFVGHEVDRALEFGRMALNSSIIDDLARLVHPTGIIVSSQ